MLGVNAQPSRRMSWATPISSKHCAPPADAAAGHIANLEQPAAFNRLVAAFIAQVEGN